MICPECGEEFDYKGDTWCKVCLEMLREWVQENE